MRNADDGQPKEALHRLAYLTEAQLCEVYDAINCYKWHDLLGRKPGDFDVLPIVNALGMGQRRYLKPIYDAISAIVPEKELMRYHHIYNLNRSGQEFEVWWRRKQIMEATGILLNPAEVPCKKSGNKGTGDSEEEAEQAFENRKDITSKGC